jgi:hypothetical protein
MYAKVIYEANKKTEKKRSKREIKIEKAPGNQIGPDREPAHGPPDIKTRIGTLLLPSSR